MTTAKQEREDIRRALLELSAEYRNAGHDLVVSAKMLDHVFEGIDATREDDAGYQEYLNEASKACRCGGQWRPCEGVLAGGLCDQLQDEADPWTGERLGEDEAP